MALSPKAQKNVSVAFRRAQDHSIGRILVGPLQSRFRMQSLSDLSSLQNGNTCVYEFSSTLHLKLSLPDDFILRFSQDLLPSLEEYEAPPISLLEIQEGSVFTDSIFNVAYFDGQNKGIREYSYTFGVKEHELTQIKIPKIYRPKNIKGTVFSFLSGGGGTYNYFHWLIDTISRLNVLQKSRFKDEDIDYYLVPDISKPFQQSTLEAIGIPPEKLITCYEYPYLKASRLLTGSHPRVGSKIPEWIIPFLRDSFLSQATLDSSVKGAPYVYVSRGDVTRRAVTNEDKVLEILSKYGFQSFRLGDLSFHEQISLFYNAKAVVGTHGAGFANFAFMKPGVPVLEFFPDDYLSHLYCDVAQQVGLDYHFMVCESDHCTKSIDSNLTVSLDILESTIEKMGL